MQSLNGKEKKRKSPLALATCYDFATDARTLSSTNTVNRPYSYSHGCTGNEHEREADAGKSFQMQIISPA